MTAKPAPWHPAIPVRPVDNLVSSEMVRLKRFIPSYERESHPNMAKIIAHDYARIWQQDRKVWANLSSPTATTKRNGLLLLRKVVNANLRKKQECPEKYRSKVEFKRKLNLVTDRPRSRNGIKKLNDCPDDV